MYPARILSVANDTLISIYKKQAWLGEVHTTAAQQTRSSYLCCGLRSRSKNQWSEPRGVSSVGKSTLSDVRIELSL